MEVYVIIVIFFLKIVIAGIYDWFYQPGKYT